MKIFTKLFVVFVFSIALLSCGSVESNRKGESFVIEVATVNLKEGVSYGDFVAVDEAVEVEHVMKQPGFISRESGPGENGEWLVIVYWRSASDAQASMKSFGSAKAAQSFMRMIDPNSMVMKRYKISK